MSIIKRVNSADDVKGMKIRLELSDDPTVCKAANGVRLWYLLLMCFSIFGGMFIDSRFFGSGDAEVIMIKIQAEQWLYQIGIASFLAGQVCQILVMLAIYRLFQSADKNQLRALLVYVAIMVPIAFIAAINKFAPIILINNPIFSRAFDAEQLRAITVLFTELQKYGMIILEIFWGLWLLPIGILVLKSGLLPKFLGLFLLIGCFGHSLKSLTVFIPGSTGMMVSQIAETLFIGELPFFLWIIIFGARKPVRS